MTIRAAFFDIDGTLVSMKTREMPASCRKALYAMKEKGIRLFISTGRPPVQIPLLTKDLSSFPWDGMILMNGQYCVDENGVPFHKLPVKKETLDVLIPWLKKEADFPCQFYEIGGSYDIAFNPGMYQYLSSLGKEDEMPPVEDPVRAFEHETYQICPYIEESRDAEFLLHAPGMESARWSPHFADMIPAGGGKAEGIRRTLEHFGLQDDEFIAFGDGGNDISMIRAAAIGVAMGNADDRVKASADYVTAECENDGIYQACVHFGLI